ncbi:MAG: N-acetylmuramoyl-L-alanine amidase [Victivallaceae bacterium]|nr:N-acetylmuramoyl-L-alanine amidase [Victivallaceae bacterium]
MRNKIGNRSFIFLAILFMNFTTFAGENVRYANVYWRNYVYLRDLAGYYGMQYSYKGDQTVLFSDYSRLIFTIDKKHCYINDIKVDLLYPSIKYKSYRCISSIDFLKTVDPIMRHWALNKHALKTIMIDPGHGGKDTGALGAKIREKDFTLELSQKLSYLLSRAGYKVYLTRNSDRFIELKDRPVLARQIGADIFISLHANKAAAKAVSGVECFCMTPVGAASTHSRRPGSKTYSGNNNCVNNVALTYWIQRALVAGTKAVDRGLKHARFMVLKEASCPAVLIETGFLSNPAEEKRLGTEWYQWQLAKGIADGILCYHYQLKRRK